MTTSRRRSHRVGRALASLAVVLPLSGGLLLVSAPAASAAISSPGRDSVVTSDATLTLRAEYGSGGGENRLTLTSPGGPPVVVATAPARLFGGTMTYALNTACWTFPSSACAGRQPAPNGVWTLTQSGATTDRLTFTLRIAPQAPTAVTATATSPRDVQLTWRRGEEPDLTGFAVLEGGQVVRSVGTGACDGQVCSTVVSYPADGTGEHSLSVRASRAVAPGSSDSLDSPASAPASATLTAPPPQPEPAPDSPVPGGDPSPGPGDDGPVPGEEPGEGDGGGAASPGPGGGSPAPSSASGGSSGGGSTASGSTTTAQKKRAERAVAQRQAFGLSFNAFGPKLGIPKLPPLPAPDVAAEPDGGFESTLGFEDEVSQELIETGGRTGALGAVGDALDSERLARSTAGALVLLLAGAHLRRWLGAPDS